MSTKGGDNANVPSERNENTESKVDNAKLQADSSRDSSTLSDSQSYDQALKMVGPMKREEGGEAGQDSKWLSYAKNEEGQAQLDQFKEQIKTMTPQQKADLIKQNDTQIVVVQGAINHLNNRLRGATSIQQISDQGLA